MEAQSLFQTNRGGSIPAPSLYDIDLISHRVAKLFIETWHYSKRIPTGKNICYGLYLDNTLYAAIIYGIGVNPYQSKFLESKGTIEIKRLCRIEPKKNYQLSKFISITSRLTHKEYSFDTIVAFADPTHGHTGGIYKAAGFTHQGDTNAEWHLVDKEGNIRHRRYAFRFARRNNISVPEARVILGLERIKTEPKYRWVRRMKNWKP